MKQAKRIRRKLNNGSKKFIHARIKYSILLIIPIILLILLPAVSFADDDRIFKENSGFIETLKQETRINPDDAGAHSTLGFACFRLGMYKEVIEAYKQTIRINPDYATAHFVLGYFYFVFKNDRGSAIEQYKILKSLDSKQANELYNLIYK